jgi:hypothetical protein
MQYSILFLLSLACITLAQRPGFQQKVHVRGRLLCGNQPAEGVYLKLVEEDGKILKMKNK